MIEKAMAKVIEQTKYGIGQPEEISVYLQASLVVAEYALRNMTGDLLEKALDVAKALSIFDFELTRKKKVAPDVLPD